MRRLFIDKLCSNYNNPAFNEVYYPVRSCASPKICEYINMSIYSQIYTIITTDILHEISDCVYEQFNYK